MTRDKDRKRIIRTRMMETGEAYTTARQHVLARSARAARPVTPARRRLPDDHETLAGKTDATMVRKTGHPWAEWVRLLDADGAASMTHRDVARMVHEKHGVDGWWAQTVTVGYERLTGQRQRGQRMDGAFEVSKSKTFDVPVEQLFDACVDDRARARWIKGVATKVRTATNAKSMRLQWPDGAIVAFWFQAKGNERSTLALAHTKLTSKAAAEHAKTEWTARLTALARMLTGERR
jgi:hypothetical protein